MTRGWGRAHGPAVSVNMAAVTLSGRMRPYDGGVGGVDGPVVSVNIQEDAGSTI